MVEYTVKVDNDGSKEWYLNGKKHREDGPAVEEANGSKYWYLNGKCHREDVEGHTITIDGKEIKLSKESFEELKAQLN